MEVECDDVTADLQEGRVLYDIEEDFNFWSHMPIYLRRYVDQKTINTAINLMDEAEPYVDVATTLEFVPSETDPLYYSIILVTSENTVEGVRDLFQWQSNEISPEQAYNLVCKMLREGVRYW